MTMTCAKQTLKMVQKIRKEMESKNQIYTITENGLLDYGEVLDLITNLKTLIKVLEKK